METLTFLELPSDKSHDKLVNKPTLALEMNIWKWK